MRIKIPDAPLLWVHAVDLGKHRCGVASALTRPGGVGTLIFASTVETSALEWSAEGTAKAVLDYTRTYKAGLPEVWVCEWPQKYDLKRVYHADLDDLHAVGHALSTAGGFRWAKRWLPAQWKGQVPKEAYHKRMMRALTEAEFANLRAQHRRQGLRADWFHTPDAHDCRDAVGILLFTLGRLRRGGGLP